MHVTDLQLELAETWALSCTPGGRIPSTSRVFRNFLPTPGGNAHLLLGDASCVCQTACPGGWEAEWKAWVRKTECGLLG